MQEFSRRKQQLSNYIEASRRPRCGRHPLLLNELTADPEVSANASPGFAGPCNRALLRFWKQAVFAEITGVACRRGDSARANGDSARANGQGQLDPMVDALKSQLSDLAKYDCVFFVLCVRSLRYVAG